MRVYADPSFLVSFLYPPDSGHPSARQLFGIHAREDWITTEWSRFETANSLRQLIRAGMSATRAEAFVRLFRHWHRIGPFEGAPVDLNDAMLECLQLSAAHGARLRMRSADVLHVALLDQLSADLFVTRDADQHALAKALGYPVVLV